MLIEDICGEYREYMKLVWDFAHWTLEYPTSYVKRLACLFVMTWIW